MSYCKRYSFGSITMHKSLDDMPVALEFEKHCHTDYEIIYVINGSGRFVSEGDRFDIAPGTVLLFPPCKFHYAEPSCDMPYERYVLKFSPADIVADDGVSDIAQNIRDVLYFSNGASIPGVLQALERLENVSHLDEQSRYVLGRLLVSEITVILAHSTPVGEKEEDNALGVRVMRYLNEKITSHITLDDIAKEFFVSKSYLCRAFKEYNKISILGYINGKRVAMARQLIEDGQTASSAAYSVGFTDYSTFFRAYKRTAGKSPTHKNVISKEKSDDDV